MTVGLGVWLLGRLRALVLLPAAVFLWLIGWSLIWIDSKKSPRKSVRTNASAEENSMVLYSELVQEPEALAEPARKR